MRHMVFHRVLLFVCLLVLSASASAADTASLAKKAQNPIANMVSLPIQNNMNFNVGVDDNPQNVTNIQPVYPFSVGDFNLINRTIVPVIYQPKLFEGGSDEFGLGDINHTTFLSPAESSDFTWGLGPVISFPSASDDVLGSGKWNAGLSAVGLTMPGRWVIGALINNVWSFAGDGDRSDVNQMLLQYFVNYNFPGGWYLSTAPILTANWKADSGNEWTIPFGGGGGKIFHVGKQPINFQTQVFYNVEKPEGGPDWQLRVQLQFLFPK